MSPSREQLGTDTTIETMQALRDEGKVRFLGMSGTLPNLPEHIATGVCVCVCVCVFSRSSRSVASECVLVAHSQAAVDCSAAVAALPGCPEPSSQFSEARLAVAMNFASPCAFTS
jgi:hypothetical protein